MGNGKGIVGGLTQDAVREQDAKRPVRNQVAQPGPEIAALRYWKAQKGCYEEFRHISEAAIWPFFEKLGARIVGMWRVVAPPGENEPEDFEEIYLLTRYASLEHWSATRDMARLGGNGPDFEACRTAVLRRNELTLETSVRFLDGSVSPGGPYFLPGLGEVFEEVSS
ncbi:MAG: hypothetical protein GY725_01990 [bacterium]|nr:hypothetical protein [bacterium]